MYQHKLNNHNISKYTVLYATKTNLSRCWKQHLIYNSRNIYKCNVHSAATLVETPVKSNAIQYNSPAINCTFTKTIMFKLDWLCQRCVTYNHNNKHIVQLTLFWQFQQELNIIIFLNVEFVADLMYWTELNCISIPNKVYICITYPINAIVELAPGPDRVRITHRLTVEYSTLALILILTALVARNIRNSWNKTTKITC